MTEKTVKKLKLAGQTSSHSAGDPATSIPTATVHRPRPRHTHTRKYDMQSATETARRPTSTPRFLT